MSKKYFIFVPLLVAAVFLTGCQNSRNQVEDGDVPNPTDTVSMTTGLDVPWEIVFLPDNSMLLTERRLGNLIKIAPDSTRTTITLPGVKDLGEGGFLGMVLHPKFAENNFIYLYFTTEINGENENRVVRYIFDGTALTDPAVIISGIPAARVHDGGRIKFGPDNKLYIATGDAGEDLTAQDLDSLSGKILRLNEDGSVPSDNPFGTSVWSYGHRNPQGMAWDDNGRMWATEHGRSGATSGFDEINLIEKGKNYGWPEIQGDETRDGMETAKINSGATTTWAPAAIVYLDGSLFFTGLRGESLYEVSIDSVTRNLSSLKQHLTKEYGRLRPLTIGPDGKFYIGTSNLDGRGTAKEGDDRIIVVDPESL